MEMLTEHCAHYQIRQRYPPDLNQSSHQLAEGVRSARFNVGVNVART